MFWILNQEMSQDWGGEVSSIFFVTKEHPQYDRYNKDFIIENGIEAKGGYVVIEYDIVDYTIGQRNGHTDSIVIGFDKPAEDVYNNILDQIGFHQGARVIDIRGYGYVGLV